MNGPDMQRQGKPAPAPPDVCSRCGLPEEQHVMIEGTGPDPWCPDMPEAQAALAARAQANGAASAPQHQPEPPTPPTEAERAFAFMVRDVQLAPPSERLAMLCDRARDLRPFIEQGLLDPAVVEMRIFEIADQHDLRGAPGSDTEALITSLAQEVTMAAFDETVVDADELAELERLAALRDAQELAEIVERISAPIAAVASTRKAKPAPAQEQSRLPIKATPFAVRDPATLPVRDILYGRHLTRGFVAGAVGIGGSGKSTLVMSETFAQVSGKPLLGVAVRRPLRVWSINLEDPRDEIEKRAQATCLHYGLTDADIGGRLFLDSGRDQPVVVAHVLAGGSKIIEPMVENIIAEIKARQIDVLRIDPFVSSHEVPENDNGAIDLVIKKAWCAVAERAGCAVELVHHLRKIGDNEPTVDDARGAGAFMAGCRAIRVVAGMTKAEGERAGIENPYRYFRVFAGKLNMAPREDKSDWLFLESVDLGNKTADRPSDHVQVAVPWNWPNALDGLSTRDLFAVQKHVSEGQWRKSATSPEWVGKAVAAVLDLDVEDAPVQNRIKSLLKTWIETGALKVAKKLDDHRKEREFVEVGQWAID